ncbi:MAG: ferritin-like domain-containing protein [Polyangiales bacterium]
MTTFVGLQMDMHSLLKNLIELDFDAMEAYDAALARLGSDAYRGPLAEFRDDHERHTEELSRVLRDGGRTPPKGPDLKRLLTNGKVVLAGLVSDRAILYALKSIERDSNVAYERATKNDHVPPQVRELLRAALADERRHRLWLEEQLEGEEPPYASPGGPSI